MSHIELIGIHGPFLDEQQRTLIGRCRAVVASGRHTHLVQDSGLPIIPIAPIGQMVEGVQQHLSIGDVAILASGDPLFFGIGKTLLRYFDPARLRVHPALSAVQLACARFTVPWDDLTLLSLHGRHPDDVAGKILTHSRVMVFTDQTNSPDCIARQLLDALKASGDEERRATVRIRVAENLGLDDEALFAGSLEAAAARQFGPLNMVLIEQPPRQQHSRFGLTAADIHHSRGLITKDEVRAASVHKLSLPLTGVLWDVGGGSGSVSLEAARINPDLSVYTIEKKPEEHQNIRRNIRSYGAYNMHLICGEAPEALKDLPAPDRVFIGGSGRRLEEIITLCAARLKPGGRIVVNAVLQTTAGKAPMYLRQQGLRVETATIAVTRTTTDSQPTVFNPITIITGSA